MKEEYEQTYKLDYITQDRRLKYNTTVKKVQEKIEERKTKQTYKEKR